MTRPALVIGFGALAIDDIVYVDRGLAAGKGRVTGRETGHGGNVATALVAVARLGGRASFVGWVGTGAVADASVRELEREGVDVSRAPQRVDAAPIRSVIVVGPDGDRFIAYDDDVPHGTSPDLADDILHEGGVLLIDGYAIHAEDVVCRARGRNLPIVADIEWSAGPATDRIIGLADHLVMPLGFTREHLRESDPSVLLDRLWSPDRSAVVLTDGERGCYVRQAGDDTRWHLPATRVTAVDTTGAGDCFHGAYARRLSQGAAPLECASYAAVAAGISVTERGGRRGLPNEQACRESIARGGRPVPVPLSESATAAAVP